MKTIPLKLLLVIFGVILFNIIFWHEKLGINTFLFEIFICVVNFYLYPYSFKNKISHWLFVGHLLTTLLVVVQNTLLSKIAFSISLLLLISFSQYIHRSAWYAGGSVLLNYVNALPNFLREILSIKKLNSRRWPGHLRILLIPLAIVFLFFIIYSSANSILSGFISTIANSLQQWFNHFFDWVPVERLIFFLFGGFIICGLVLRNRKTYFSDKDMKQKNHLLRKKNNFKRWKENPFSDLLHIVIGNAAKGILVLKKEYMIGTLSLVLLNLLLFSINMLDIKYVWLNNNFNNNSGLSASVHEGAGLLIFSIVLAMLLLLIFFCGNLNFYKKNKWLRVSAYVWIFQNSFLVFSVFLRDYYYISHLGLAYKRIGILFFLAMVLSGLITVFIKIYYTKTIYFLLRINAWIGLVLLLFASTVNWDVTIAKYNLAKKTTIPVDVPFLLSLSDKTLPLMQKNLDVLEKDTSDKFFYDGNYFEESAINFFEYRQKKFLDEQAHYTWLSWNLSDAFIKKELKQKSFVSLLKK